MSAASTRWRVPVALLCAVALALAWSGIGPKDRTTWWLEVLPILIAAPLLLWTYRRFPFTTLVYVLIAVHAVVLVIGAHYTYAEVPLGFWVRDLLDLGRNHYDRLGHFVQGFVPAMVVREILLRSTPLPRGGWLFFLTSAVCLAISAMYEFLEWASAVLGGSAADAFLGTQGDIWDTQWDMFMCLIGALVAQVTLARVQDHQLIHVPGAGEIPA